MIHPRPDSVVRMPVRCGLVAAAMSAVLLGCAAAHAQTGGKLDAKAKAFAPLVAAHNASGQMLFRQFAAQPGNIVFSPHSVATAMDMALAGARGTTASQMRSVLRHTLPLDQVDAANKALHDQINGNLNDDVKSLSANALMLTGAKVRKEYEALLRSQYGAEIFAGAQVETVNGWVNDKTQGKIPKLIDEVDAGDAIILNAVYFKAAWEAKFDAKLTRPSEFNLTAARKVDVATMRQRRRYAFASNEGYGAIKIPYAGTSIAMVVVRPDEIEGAKKVALKLGGKELAALFAQLRSAAPGDVDLTLPRFRAEFGADLSSQFNAAGMVDAFDAIKANFSGIAGRGFYIQKFVHKAFVDVTEEGAEAAAATAVRKKLTTSISIDTTRPFHVDRPFLFYIVEMNSGAILFQGLIQDPSPKQS